MNTNYNYSDFSELNLTSNNDSQRYEKQLELRQIPSHAEESNEEKHIIEMLLSHSKYHVYCE